MVQKLNLLPARDRLEKMKQAGFNTFLLHNGDIFMDMLTDSGVNAMSDNMQSAMLRADDAYAGSETFYRMQTKLEEIFGISHLLPTHQGRACEHIIAQHFVKPGNCVIMNYHFTTSKAHVTRLGGHVVELVKDEGLIAKSNLPFKNFSYALSISSSAGNGNFVLGSGMMDLICNVKTRNSSESIAVCRKGKCGCLL